ncbi:hypothetical protein [Malacoplasma muris]
MKAIINTKYQWKIFLKEIATRHFLLLKTPNGILDFNKIFILEDQNV